MNTLKMLLIALTFSYLLACSTNDEPDDNNGNTYSSKELALHNGSKKLWKVNKQFFNGTDITSSFEDCVKDNIHVIDIHGNYDVDEGNTKCEPSDPDVMRGFYELNEDLTVISIDDRDTVIQATILDLKSGRFEYEWEAEGASYRRVLIPFD